MWSLSFSVVPVVSVTVHIVDVDVVIVVDGFIVSTRTRRSHTSPRFPTQINQSINQLFNRLIDSSVNQSINQPNNQSFKGEALAHAPW